MYLNDFIAQLEVIRAQYGDLQVWVEAAMPPVRIEVREFLHDPRRGDELEKVVIIG